MVLYSIFYFLSFNQVLVSLRYVFIKSDFKNQLIDEHLLLILYQKNSKVIVMKISLEIQLINVKVFHSLFINHSIIHLTEFNFYLFIINLYLNLIILILINAFLILRM